MKSTKNFVSIMLTFIMAFSCFAFAPAAYAEDGYQGDGAFDREEAEEPGPPAGTGSGDPGELGPLAAPNVCVIVETNAYYSSLTDALSAAMAADNQTIRLLSDIIYDRPIAIDDKTLTLDLNGKSLDLISDEHGVAGLAVTGGAKLKLLDPHNGEFNVTGVEFGVYASDGSKAVVTNAAITASGNSSCIRTVDPDGWTGAGSEVTVLGDISSPGHRCAVEAGKGTRVNVTGSVFGGDQTVVYSEGVVYIGGDITAYPNSGNPAAEAWDGGKITVGGSIIVGTGPYVRVGGTVKTQAEGVASASKPGYLEYANGANIVWVADSAADAVCEIVETGEMYASIPLALEAIKTSAHRTIKLLEDVTVSDSVNLIDKNITFALGAYDLTFDNSGDYYSKKAIDLENSHVDYTGTGTFEISGDRDDNNVNKMNQFSVIVSVNNVSSSLKATRIVLVNTAHGGIGCYNGEFVYTGSIISDGEQSSSVGAAALVNDGLDPSIAPHVTVNGNIDIESFFGTGVYAHDRRSRITVNGNIKLTGDINDGVSSMSGTIIVNGNINIDGKKSRAVVAYGDIDSEGTVVVSATPGTITVNGSINLQGDNWVPEEEEDDINEDYNFIAVEFHFFAGRVTINGAVTMPDVKKSYFAARRAPKGHIDWARTKNQYILPGDRAGYYMFNDELSRVETYIDGSGIRQPEYDAGGNLKYLLYYEHDDPGNPFQIYYNEYFINYLWVKAQNFSAACEIVETGIKYAGFADAWKAAGGDLGEGKGADRGDVAANNMTIRLLRNESVSKGLLANKKNITLDLNGKTLNAVNNAGPGLLAKDGGSVKLLDPNNGVFNVTGTSFGGAAEDGFKGPGYIEVSSAKATGAIGGVGGVAVSAVGAGSLATVFGSVTAAGSGGTGAYAEYGGRIISRGNITTSGNNSTGAYAYGADSEITIGGNIAVTKGAGVGAAANAGGKVTVDGTITIPSDGTWYVGVSTAERKPNQNETVSSKGGYSEYKNGTGADTSYVWVKDPAAVAVCSIGAALYYSLPDAIAAIPAGGSGTIKILRDHTYTYNSNPALTIENKAVTLDLNGKKVSLVNENTNSAGLSLTNGQLKLADPHNGEFNVTGTLSGVIAYASKVEVTNATAAGTSYGGGIGITVLDSASEIIVYGNVNVLTTGTSTNGSRIGVSSNGKAVVHGTILMQASDAYNYYITLQGSTRQKSAHTSPSTMTGFLMYTVAGTAFVFVKDHDSVCSIGSTMYTDLGAALTYVNGLPAGSFATIRLLKDIKHTSTITINNKKVTLDLNGHTLDVVTTTTYGVNVSNGGELKMLDPYNGEFNVTAVTFGIYTQGGSNKIMVSNVKASDVNAYVVYAQSSGDEVTVYGDVALANSGSQTSYGVYSTGFAKVVVNGKISVPTGSNYIGLGTSMVKTPGSYAQNGDGTPYSTRAGYLMYTNAADPSGAEGSYHTVWVRDTAARPVCTIGGDLYFDFGVALAAALAADNKTIRLLQDVNYGYDILVDGKSVTFDVNGFILNVRCSEKTNTALGDALEVRNNGKVFLADSVGCGEFNVVSTVEYSAGVVASRGGMAEVTNATGLSVGAAAEQVSGNSGKITVFGEATGQEGGAQSRGANGEIVVYGNAIATGVTGANFGVDATAGGKVTVFGDAAGNARGVNVSGTNSKVYVYGNVTVSPTVVSGAKYGVYANGSNCEAIVHGNVVVANPVGGPIYGTYATASGAGITVDGEIIMLPGIPPVGIGTGSVSAQPTSTKPGYIEYKNVTGTASYIWVRDPSAFMPVSEIIGVPAEAVAGVPLTLSGNVIPAHATNRTIVWSVQNAGTTGAAVTGGVLKADSAGTVYVRATVANGLGEGKAYTQSFVITVKAPAATLISLSPTHAILANKTDSVKFEAVLPQGMSGQDNYSKVKWSVNDPGVSLAVTGEGRFATAKVVGSVDPARTVKVTAVYDKVYTATATVEVMDGGAASIFAKLLETSVTVNAAKDVGALLPVFISQQGYDFFGLSAMSGTDMAGPKAAGSVVVENVSLFTKDKSGDFTVPVQGYSAKMYGSDDRYIAISAESGAKPANNVGVLLKIAGGLSYFAEGTLKLTATETYPKITFKADDLNLAFPNRASALTATSSDGSNVTVRKAEVVDAKSKLNIRAAGSHDAWEHSLTSAAVKGSHKTRVWLDVEGYKTPFKGKDFADITVKVVDTSPKLKLTQTAVNLLGAGDGGGAAAIGLVSADAKIPFESGYKVSGVTASNTDAKGKLIPANKKAEVDVSYAGGVISVKPKAGCASGNALLKVSFTGSDRVVYLSLKVTIVKPGDLKPVSKLKALTVSTGHDVGSVTAEIPVTYGVDNHVIDDWEVKDVGGVLFSVSDVGKAKTHTPGQNKVTLTVINKVELENLVNANGSNKKHVLNIGSAKFDALTGKANQRFAVTLTMTGSDAGITLTTKGKIDVVNPASAITVTAKLTNTASDIASVRLLTNTGAGAKDFSAVVTGANTFNIVAAHKTVVPGVPQSVTARVTLKNGVTLVSKAIAVTPAQTKAKAAQTKKAVTLYKLTPLTGESVGLSFASPANAKLGAVRLEQKTLDGFKLVHGLDDAFGTDGFRIEQSGAGDWTISFKDAIAPKATKNGNAAALGSSYNLKLELWAVGTYETDMKGNFKGPLKDAGGAAKTAPTIVTVKVSIK